MVRREKRAIHLNFVMGATIAQIDGAARVAVGAN